MNIQYVTDKIKWISQMDANSDDNSNDCGAASIAMVMSAWLDNLPTVDEIYNDISSTDRYLSVSQLQRYLSKRGIDTDYSRNSSIAVLQQRLMEGHPAIILFNYGTYRRYYNTDTGFNGAHFAVVPGFDTKGFIMFDPLALTEKHGIVHVAYNHFNEMWTDANKQGNSARSMVWAFEPEVQEKSTGEKLRITTRALRVRSTPGVKGTNYTRQDVYKNQVFPVLDKQEYNPNEVWVKIGDSRWVAAVYRGVQYAIFE